MGVEQQNSSEVLINLKVAPYTQMPRAASTMTKRTCNWNLTPTGYVW